ncbi:phosphotransferase [Streptomyces sp. NPDC004980]
MSAATAMSGDLARWVTKTVGPVSEVRNASRERAGSRVWEVNTHTDVRYFVKVAPEPAFYTRETFAYRHAVPVLGGGRAAALVDSSPRRLAMVLTAVGGAPLDRRSLSHGVRREAHRQAGTLLRRFHDAMTTTVESRAQARASGSEAAVGAERELRQAGDHVTADEARLLRRLTSRLPDLADELPVGLRHGDFRERNLLWDGRRLSLIGFEHSAPSPLAADFVGLGGGLWPEHHALRGAFFGGYGRRLSEAEEHALVCFAAADAVGCLARGARNGDRPVTERGRRTVDRLMKGAYA